MASILVTSSIFAGSILATRQCNTTATFCPTYGICCSAQYSPTKFGCRLPNTDPFTQSHFIRSSDYGAHLEDAGWPPSPTQSCCMPGPGLEPSTTQPNCLILGDSVSIGYAGVAAKALADVCMTQHSPYDVADGGAGSTAVGVACLDNFLVTQRQTPVKWDVILYNFGLHDLDNSTAGEATYRKQLTNITARLVATGAKLIYATTTPFMPMTTIGDDVVADLNSIARDVIKGKSIGLLDLHEVVMETCSPPPAHTAPYTNCSICRREPCSYHYNSIGETAQGKAVAAAMRPLVAEALASRVG